MKDHAIQLDADELMHLALHAIQTDSPEKSLEHLKRLLKLEPGNGKAHYLMGAVHAQIGMHEQAAGEMAQALELEPDLHTARFQLGLLHITSGKTSEAETVWSKLDGLGDKDPLYLFKKGMLHLVSDEFDQCAEALKTGIELNTFNEDLNNDMRRVLKDAVNMIAKQPATDITDEDDNNPSKGRQILLSVYQDKDEGGS